MKNKLVIGSIILGVVLVCGLVGLGLFVSFGSRSGGMTASMVAEAPSPLAYDRASEEASIEAMPTTVVSFEAQGAPAAQGVAQPVERLIIRNGNISLIVKDTRAAQAEIEAMVAGMAGEGAFVVSSDEQGGLRGESPRISMLIRVPVGRFAETMDDLAALAVEVTSRNESGQDVTEEYVDLQARLESLGTARQRLLEIMKEARTTSDLLQAEQQLTQREAEIESIKGRLQYLSQAAQLSSIHITLEPDRGSQPVDTRWRPARTVREAIETLVDNAQGFGDFLIFFAIAVLPWLVGLGLVIYLIFRVARWQVGKRKKKEAAPPAAR